MKWKVLFDMEQVTRDNQNSMQHFFYTSNRPCCQPVASPQEIIQDPQISLLSLSQQVVRIAIA